MLDQVLKGPSRDVFEHQKRRSRMFLDGIYCADRRMVQRRHGARFPFQPVLAAGIARRRLWQELDCHLPPQLGVGGEVHISHPTPAQQRMHAVMPDSLGNGRLTNRSRPAIGGYADRPRGIVPAVRFPFVASKIAHVRSVLGKYTAAPRHSAIGVVSALPRSVPHADMNPAAPAGNRPRKKLVTSRYTISDPER